MILYLYSSVAILQYLADKYKKDETFYPVDPEQRALVNHRLAFHLSTYYRTIVDYMVQFIMQAKRLVIHVIQIQILIYSIKFQFQYVDTSIVLCVSKN